MRQAKQIRYTVEQFRCFAAGKIPGRKYCRIYTSTPSMMAELPYITRGPVGYFARSYLISLVRHRHGRGACGSQYQSARSLERAGVDCSAFRREKFSRR